MLHLDTKKRVKTAKSLSAENIFDFPQLYYN